MYADVNGLHMYYETHGEGLPLVALHGGMLSIDLTFRDVLPALADGRQVIAIDLQGHGRTADIDREPLLSHLADDVLALLDQLGVAQADFIGFSLGGLVSLTIATTRPERVNRLFLASTHFRQAGYHDEIAKGDMSSSRMPTEQEFQSWLEAYGPGPDSFWAFSKKLTGVVHSFEDWTPDQLRAITAPTLLVVGDNDFIRLSHAEEMRDLLPNAHLAVLPNTRHSEVMERADLLVPLIKDYL